MEISLNIIRRSIMIKAPSPDLSLVPSLYVPCCSHSATPPHAQVASPHASPYELGIVGPIYNMFFSTMAVTSFSSSASEQGLLFHGLWSVILAMDITASSTQTSLIPVKEDLMGFIFNPACPFRSTRFHHGRTILCHTSGRARRRACV